jgi:hypothetical protein
MGNERRLSGALPTDLLLLGWGNPRIRAIGSIIEARRRINGK